MERTACQSVPQQMCHFAEERRRRHRKGLAPGPLQDLQTPLTVRRALILFPVKYRELCLPWPADRSDLHPEHQIRRVRRGFFLPGHMPPEVIPTAPIESVAAL